MKTLSFIFITIFCALVNTGWSQTNLLNGPEGIAYHQASKSYFVSNANNGKIIKIDSLMNQEVFYQGFSVPMGVEIVGDSLFVASNDPSTITCIEIYNGELVGSMLVPESPSMAHMDIDKRSGFLYVVGQAGDVFKIDTKTLSYNVFVGSGLPNGTQACNVDTINNCLYIFSWPVTFVRSINLADSSDIQNLVNPLVGQNIDCTKDIEGNVYVSSWQGDKINKFPPDCSSVPEVFETGFNKPAGLIYNPDENLIAVCNFGGNTVDYIELGSTGTGQNMIYDNKNLKVYPNPVEMELNVELKNNHNQEKTISVYNLQGYEWASNHFTGPSTRINMDLMPDGIYILKIETGEKSYTKRIVKF